MSTAYVSTTSRNTRSLKFRRGRRSAGGEENDRRGKKKNTIEGDEERGMKTLPQRLCVMRGCHNQPIVHVATSVTSSAVIILAVASGDARGERNASRPRVTRGVPAFGSISASVWCCGCNCNVNAFCIFVYLLSFFFRYSFLFCRCLVYDVVRETMS